MRQFDVSVVLPAKNEAKNLSALLREIAEVVPSTTTEIIVVDDENRENEGDFILPAETVTPEIINFMAIHGR